MTTVTELLTAGLSGVPLSLVPPPPSRHPECQGAPPLRSPGGAPAQPRKCSCSGPVLGLAAPTPASLTPTPRAHLREAASATLTPDLGVLIYKWGPTASFSGQSARATVTQHTRSPRGLPGQPWVPSSLLSGHQVLGVSQSGEAEPFLLEILSQALPAEDTARLGFTASVTWRGRAVRQQPAEGRRGSGTPLPASALP